MRPFDTVVVVDWSANSTPKTGKDSIWIGCAGAVAAATYNPPTRAEATAWMIRVLQTELAAHRRVLVGFDFPFGYPKGFAKALTGQSSPFAVWDILAQQITDGSDNQNNRFKVASALNQQFPGIGPFWGCPPTFDDSHLPAKGTARQGHGMAEHRACDRAAKGAQPVWKLFTTGSVGSQALMGLPRVQHLRQIFGRDLAVAPFETPDTPIVLAEVFPSLISGTVKRFAKADEVPDQTQVRVLSAALAKVPPDTLDMWLREGCAEEGWILGLGHKDDLAREAERALAPFVPPALRNDCFAMPQGVDWMPVDTALERLKGALHPITQEEETAVNQASGRVLARDAYALRSNPPRANAAVDGYGFALDTLGAAPHALPLVKGRAAAGVPYDGSVPPGYAVRILTGAILPQGVDTIVLEEDTATNADFVTFQEAPKRGSNTRKAGEDMAQGALALPLGHRLRAPDLALLSALGIAKVNTFRPLRVGVLSTGDEIVTDPTQAVQPHQIYDANRPMLLSLAKSWGFETIDLGHAADDAAQIAAKLDKGAQRADVILTSGGASAGDEDHVSRLLRDKGTLSSWRIAVKPGRPLAFAMWQGTPVFGLPGNPVAAMVCALIFARPALSLMSGAGWQEPQGFMVPAAFSKAKKPGRREYLRARLNSDGQAEVFQSEGSGRISGLSWADGLVELPDNAMEVTPGTFVRYLPYASFGVT